ncbi:MAG: preprotein translocase subunit Sec61beta [Archaeoglobi archaeon]|nr:preprotein translocase subunit Sec61beta [Candidatus Mnemosynella sp.]
MPKKESKETGLISSAGLMRYYNIRDSNIEISPKTVILGSLILGILVIILNLVYGLWP